MTSPTSSGFGTDVTTNNNPATTPRNDNSEENDALRLTGVRSNNPFAGASNGENNHNTDVESPRSPGAGSSEFHDAASIVDPTATTSNEPVEAESPTAVGPTQSVNTTTHQSPTEAGQPKTERTVGGAVFANADPFHADSRNGSSDESKSDGKGDSDSYTKESGGHIAFHDPDKITNVASHSSNNVWDKIKSQGHHAKEKFHLQDIKSTGPLKGFNPTNVHMRIRFGDDPSDSSRDVGIIWRSRDNRKGRNSIMVPRASMAYPNLPPQNQPVYSSSLKGVGQNLYRMAFSFPYWDMAFWSGWSYTWGSVIFVIDGTWAWIPYGWGLDLGGISEYGVGILFFIGALLYQLGAVMAYLEAVNEGSFCGSAMNRFLSGHENDQKVLLDDKLHDFFGHLNPLHGKKQREAEEAEQRELACVDPEAGWKTVNRRRRQSIYSDKNAIPRRGGIDLGEEEEGESHEYTTWRWWPTWEVLKTHHRYEIGYIACSIQLFGATLYSWCGLVALPPVFAALDVDSEYGAYWFPEVLGSCCFLTASALFLVETQEKWWKPQLSVMGWWIGFWAMIGSWGFLFCGIFGFVDVATELHWAGYQSELSSTWGSFAYLISGFCQWYEAVNKHPVEEGSVTSQDV